MESNGIDSIAQLVGEEESFRIESADHSDFSPLVNRIAFGIAKELAVAIKELEHHVHTEARRGGEAAERRLESFQDDLAGLGRFMGEQRSLNAAVQEQLHHLSATDGDLREAHSRHAGELEMIRVEARDFSSAVSSRFDATMSALEEANSRHASEREALLNEARASLQPIWDRIDGLSRHLDSQQEDIATTKNTLNTMCSRIDGFVERLDRQAGALRSLHGAYGQRESELDQIVEGLARLKSARPTIPEEL